MFKLSKLEFVNRCITSAHVCDCDNDYTLGYIRWIRLCARLQRMVIED